MNLAIFGVVFTGFLMGGIAIVVNHDKILLIRKLQTQLKKTTETTVKQFAIIEQFKGTRCGKHVFTLEDRVLLAHQINGLPHVIVAIQLKKNKETMYMCKLGNAAQWVPEHSLRLKEES